MNNILKNLFAQKEIEAEISKFWLNSSILECHQTFFHYIIVHRSYLKFFG